METKEYDVEFIFTKLKKRVVNTKPKVEEPIKIKIEEPVEIDLEVIDLGEVE
jgi:hypothetical protein